MAKATQHQKTLAELRMQAGEYGREEAERDLKFAGDSALQKMELDDEQVKYLREALKFYASNAASRAVGWLHTHGKLKLD